MTGGARDEFVDVDGRVRVRVTSAQARQLAINGVTVTRVTAPGRWFGFYAVCPSVLRVWELRDALAQARGEDAARFVYVVWPEALARAARDDLWSRAVSAAYDTGGPAAALALLPTRAQTAKEDA